MNLESLPNEILLDLFDCLDGYDLLRAFSSLNSRFNYLLYKQYRGYIFNFDSISKRKFDIICQQYLPLIAKQVMYLPLYTNDNTPEQINLFFSYIPSISQFTHLRFLTLFSVNSYQLLIHIVDECYHLGNLNHLNLCYNGSLHDQIDFQLIMNKIWSLSTLTHCRFDLSTNEKQVFCPPTILSTSLENLYIDGFDFKLTDIHRIVEYTPCLKRIRTSITLFDDDDDKLSPIPSLINLNIIVPRMTDPWKQISFLQNMPNLRYLTVNTFDNLINGYQWEQIIRNYLPKLKIFVLSMSQQFPDNQNIQEQVDELINSFRKSFWIDEHRWFVRCFTNKKTIRLETSSRMLGDFNSNFPDSWRSTYPYDNQEKFYNNMISTYDDTLFNPLLPFDIHFDNIHDLRLKLPITDKLWAMIPNLNKLRSLSISSHTDTYQCQLQTLLSRAPHLRDLHIHHNKSSPLQMSLFEYRHSSICQLNIRHYWFNEKECVTLTHSQLGVQCEELTIQVKNRQCIIILAQNIITPRFLCIESKDDKFVERLLLIEDMNEIHEVMKSNKDELVEWLKERLSSTYAISRDPYFVNHIRIWI